ncbi:MAG: DUF4159 domain-containing protein [Planctomycetia bacterium]|nr:DUF4159 domain-containing protein [Planctomycetia bacterium]
MAGPTTVSGAGATRPGNSCSAWIVAMVAVALWPWTTVAQVPQRGRGDEPDEGRRGVVSPERIQRAIDKARDWLVRQQEPNGSWECTLRTENNRIGASALVMLALANAGLPRDHLSMQRGLDWIRRQKPDDTYSVSLQTMLLAMISPDADRPILQRNVDWLEATQVAQGPAAGAWSYGKGKGSGDNSNSQFALLALHEADRVGVRVKDEVWQKAQRYWTACARPDGSWGYTIGNGGGGTGSMTCAGVASVWITAEHVGAPDARATREAVACCGGGTSPRVLEKGLEWLGRRFTAMENPGQGAAWHFYYLYGLERVGRFTARRFIGDADWYLEGARMFVDAQDPFTGNYRGKQTEDPIVNTSFALLFLAKGRRPVIVAKSRHGPDIDWNRHGHDIAHLVEHVEARWKRDYPAGLSWHVIDTPAADAADLLQAPVLWLSGKDGMQLGPDAGPRLRRYIDEGGFIFAEACCPGSDAFDRKFRQLVGEIFPEPEYDLHLLPPEHPAWHAEEVVPAELQRPLLGVDYGCRTCIIYAPPNDLGGKGASMPSLSCLWEIGGPARRGLPAGIAAEVDAALAVGTNILAYATNREVKRKDELFAIEANTGAPTDQFDRGRLTIGKLRHGGLCDAAPAALANILRAATRELGIRVDDTPDQIDLTDDRLFDHHLVFMHGRQSFSYDLQRRDRLRQFLERGGTLLADSVCASAAFSESFRREIAAVLPEAKLEEIAADDPIFTAHEYGGYDIREVTLREPQGGGNGPLGATKRRIAPRLEGIRIGDRWAVIFSPYDLSCALEKQNSMECAGYGREDAERIALNVLLYSLNQ